MCALVIVIFSFPVTVAKRIGCPAYFWPVPHPIIITVYKIDYILLLITKLIILLTLLRKIVLFKVLIKSLISFENIL